MIIVWGEGVDRELPGFLFLCWPFSIVSLLRWILSQSRRLRFSTSFTLVLYLLRDFWLLLDHYTFEGSLSVLLHHRGPGFWRVILWLGGIGVRFRDRWWWGWPRPGGHGPVGRQMVRTT